MHGTTKPWYWLAFPGALALIAGFVIVVVAGLRATAPEGTGALTA